MRLHLDARMQTHYRKGPAKETPTMIESVITTKSQTTLPSGVRKALGVGPGDRLAYVVEGNRAIIMKARRGDAHEDPIAEAFLTFLAQEMEAYPERLAGLITDLVERARVLTDGIEVHLDAPLEGDVVMERLTRADDFRIVATIDQTFDSDDRRYP